MHNPLPLMRILVILLVFPLVLAACGRQLSQEELLARAQQSFTEGKLKAAEIDAKTALQEDSANADGRRLLGEIRLRQRNVEEAAIDFGKSLAAQPDPAVAALYAEALLGAGQAEKVVALQEDGLFTSAAKNPTFLAILARAQAINGDTFTARHTLDSAQALEPANPQVQLTQALLLARHSEDIDGALEVLRGLTETHPEFADAWTFYGDLARAASDAQQAETAYRAASQLNRFRLDDRLDLVAVLIDQEKYSEAAAELETLEEIIPQEPRMNYAQARIAMSEGNTDLAVKELDQVLNVAPNHMPSVYLVGYAHFRAGNFDLAEYYLKTFLAAQPRNINARQMLAVVYLRAGEVDKAENLVRQLVKESPMNMKSLKILAMVLAAQGLHAESAGVYEELAAISPDAPEVQMELGMELARGGEFERGMQELEKAKALDPDNLVIRTRLVLMYAARGDESAVQRELDALRSLVGPTDPRPDELAGDIALRAGDRERATEYFSRALELDPGSSAARTGIATIAMQQGDSDGAVATLKEGLEVDPGNLRSLMNLAAVYENRGETDQMVATLDEAVKANPDVLEPRLQLARHNLQQGRPGETVDLLAVVREAYEEDPRVHQLLTGAFLSLNEPGAAVTSGRQLVKLLPENPVALRLGAQAELANGDPKMAEKYLRQGLAVRPEDVESRKLLIQSLMLQNKLEESSAELALMPEGVITNDKTDLARGEIELALGRPLKAEALLRKAYAAKPDDINLAFLNVALMRQGKLDEAQQLLDSWLASHPDDQLILRQLGWSYVVAGREDKAVAIYEKLNLLSPDDPLILNNLAWASRKIDSKRALEYIEKALQASPQSPAMLDTKAMILTELGDYDEALTVNQRALDLSENNTGFLFNRAEILAAAGDGQGAAALMEGMVADERFAEDPRLKALLEKYQAL